MPLRINVNDTRNIKGHKADKKYVFKNLWRYLKPHLPLLAAVFLCNIASTILALADPWLCGLAINEIKADGSTDLAKIGMYAAILGATYIISALTLYLSSVGMVYISRTIIKKMRCDAFAKLVTLPVGYFDSRQTGDIISVLSYDIDTVGESLSNDVIMVLKSLVQITGSFIMMLTVAVPLIIISPKASSPLLLIFAVTVPLSLLVTRFIVKKVQPLFRKRSRKLGELNGFVEEMVTGRLTTKAYCREADVTRQFESRNREAIEAYNRAEYYGTMTGPSVTFINNITMTLISVFGGLTLILAVGGASAGGIAEFVLYARKFSGPINEVANVMGEFQSAIAAAERVFRVLDEAPEPDDGEDAAELTDVRGDVQIENLSFGYEKDKPVIKDFNLSVKSGQTVAIVGHTGAGKTTVINLLMRFYEPDGGTIKIDGQDISKITRASLRRSFTMVLQESWLFAGTVCENIAYSKPEATREEIERVCRAAKIHSFITRLPKGYDTVLTDNAVNISKGQKQLLTIARAMLLDSPMLILDEATSNVDTRTEQIIQDAMRTLMKGRTCFVIAHRLSTIKNADKILVMRGGNVVEQGTHSSLMAADGYYAELYRSQFENS